MSNIIIIGLLGGGLFILITMAVILQSLEKNRKEKKLRENALNSRARNFQYLLDGFPQGFLSRDLQVLVCKCLADAYEQLARLNGRNSTYSKQRDLYTERLQQFREKAASEQAVSIGDMAKIREVQKLLSSLHKFIAKLVESKEITAPEAKSYSQQIRQRMLSTTVEALTLQIHQAISENKPRLAIHHIQTAIGKLSQNNGNGQHTPRISALKQQMADLENQAQSQEAESDAKRDEADKEWDELNKPDDSWKKKAIYD